MSINRGDTATGQQELVAFGAVECLGACVSLLEGARSGVLLLSRRLDPMVYDTEEVVAALGRLISQRRDARVRILVEEPELLVSRGHRLVTLMRRFTTFMDIRRPGEGYRPGGDAYLVVDGRTLFYQERADRREGVWGEVPRRAAELSAAFGAVWDHSREIAGIRRLYL